MPLFLCREFNDSGPLFYPRLLAGDELRLIFVLTMLSKLNIRNYAIIDELTITFSPGLNIITGETGAGKSILMGALSLILGERADTAALQNRDQKCVVEGSFDIEGRADIRRFLTEEDLDEEDELIIRREINPAGKSRAFINDTPVTLEQLRTLSGMMVDLHRQFDTLDIGKSGFQRSVLDALAGNAELLDQYGNSYSQWQSVLRRLAKLRADIEQFNREADYYRFQYNELEDFNCRENEMEDIEVELKLLSQSEQLSAALARAVFTLTESEQPLVQQLKSLVQQLVSYGDVLAPLAEAVNRLQSVQVELNDIAGELEDLQNKVQHDPERLAELNDRLAEGYRLMKKHGLQDSAGLIALRSELESKLQAVSQADEDLGLLEAQAAELETVVLKLGKELSKKRVAVISTFEDQVNALLHQVGMPNARLSVSCTVQDPGEYGIDAIDFLFDANRSGKPEPVRKVASGGELSRLMLCIKSLVARSMDLPTLIFDEIDSGISGEAARQVGIILKGLGAARQVLCITHQPQIAGRADAHYYVYKKAAGESVKTHIRRLDDEERITAIARMLSGETPTAAAIENAREMIAG